jgi:Leucine-rich repeat (LRR) protein
MIASEEQGRAEALRRIAVCRETRGDELDLGGLQLTSLDDILEPLCELAWLRRLFLGLSTAARENRELAFFDRKPNSQVCNSLAALPDTLFDALTRLEHLDLAFNSLNCLPSIAKLAALTNLNLERNRVGDEGAQALKDLTSLMELHLSFNDLGNDGAQALKNLTALTSLKVSGNKIGREGVQALTGLTALTSLDLSANFAEPGGLSAEDVKPLKNLSALTKLEMTHTSMGSEGVLALTGLTSLTSLNLSWTNIEDDGAQALKNLTTLTSLDLAGCGIGAEGAQGLKGLSALIRLDLTFNSLRDDGVKAPPARPTVPPFFMSVLKFQLLASRWWEVTDIAFCRTVVLNLFSKPSNH